MAMQTYMAQLGHSPIISLAELYAVFSDLLPVHLFNGQYFVFQTKEDIDQALLNHLGGTVLIARQITEDALHMKDIPTLMATELKDAKGKVTFAIRADGISSGHIRDLFRACKEKLKSNSQPSRYIGNEKTPALPVQLHDAGMIHTKNGCEMVILRDKTRTFIGKTIAAQDTKAYTLRDMEKPVRDTTSGLLPPKLAQILLNFGTFLVAEKTGKNPKTLTVLDPFCGTGVIPIECMIRGWNVLASDLSGKAVSGCEKNIEWARKTYKITKKDVVATVWKQDAQKPFALKTMPDVIVTETYLGPAMTKRPSVKDVEKLRKENEALQKAFLMNMKASFPGVPVVATWPVWYAKAESIRLQNMPKVCTHMGFTMTIPMESPSAPDMHSLLYRRKDQFVGREIVLLLPQ